MLLRAAKRTLLAKSELANRRINELSLENQDRWRLWIDGPRTDSGEKPSTRRKNMVRDVLCQILELTRQHYRIEDLTIGLRVFRDADESNDEWVGFGWPNSAVCARRG
jgi:hypothetical protein